MRESGAVSCATGLCTLCGIKYLGRMMGRPEGLSHHASVGRVGRLTLHPCARIRLEAISLSVLNPNVN